MPPDVDLAALKRRAGNLGPRELIAVAVELGWEHVRTSGSHAIMRKLGLRLLAIPQHRRIPVGTVLSIIRTLERDQ